MKVAQVNAANFDQSWNIIITVFIAPPQNVTLTSTEPEKLELRWSPPPEFAVTLYIVIFQDETYHINPLSDLVMELNSLMTYTTYTCCVAANTTSGPSTTACDTQTTLETGKSNKPMHILKL